jgi:microcystin-dependent protein
MTQSFTGEIDIFAFNFPPHQWAFADGSTLAIQQNTALFSLLGTTYGGNGTRTFQLPNLALRAPCSQGAGPGLTPRPIGGAFGSTTVSLTGQQIPPHTHTWSLESGNNERLPVPAAGSFIASTKPQTAIYLDVVTPTPPPPVVPFSPNSILPTGANQPHANQQPYLAMNYSICLYGVFPPFS